MLYLKSNNKKLKDENGGNNMAGLVLDCKEVSNRERIANIRENIANRESLCEVIERLFKVEDINKIKDILENELFYEYILDEDIDKFYKSVKNKNINQNDFINEYCLSGRGGIFNVLTMLEVL